MQREAFPVSTGKASLCLLHGANGDCFAWYSICRLAKQSKDESECRIVRKGANVVYAARGGIGG